MAYSFVASSSSAIADGREKRDILHIVSYRNVIQLICRQTALGETMSDASRTMMPVAYRTSITRHRMFTFSTLSVQF